MASGPVQPGEYHQQFTEPIIRALKAGTAPWQKAWQPDQRILPRNFSSGRGYRGGNAVYLAMTALDRGYADPRWGGWRQIREAGGYVRKGEKGTPIMYVDWRQRLTAGDEHGNRVLGAEELPKLEWVLRDRPLVKLHYVFNVEQTEGLKLRSLPVAAPEWEGRERAEALIRSSGIRVDHVADDRAYYNFFEDRVVLPERSRFPSPSAYTHTALHELGHATGHPSRLDRPTFVNHGGFGSETYAREELRAEIAAMMTGERARRRARATPRHGVRQFVDQGPGERPDGDARRGRRRPADLGLADRPRPRADTCPTTRRSTNGPATQRRRRQCPPATWPFRPASGPSGPSRAMRQRCRRS